MKQSIDMSWAPPCGHRFDAHGRRVDLDSYWTCVEHRAEIVLVRTHDDWYVRMWRESYEILTAECTLRESYDRSIERLSAYIDNLYAHNRALEREAQSLRLNRPGARVRTAPALSHHGVTNKTGTLSRYAYVHWDGDDRTFDPPSAILIENLVPADEPNHGEPNHLIHVSPITDVSMRRHRKKNGRRKPWAYRRPVAMSATTPRPQG